MQKRKLERFVIHNKNNQFKFALFWYKKMISILGIYIYYLLHIIIYQNVIKNITDIFGVLSTVNPWFYLVRPSTL